ncbi:glycosyltransferase [Deltaproteobacteria bacterium]|nr:glycosyltransferase [Deltaproteobacteria bacterium]
MSISKSEKQTKKVCMLLINNFTNDSRVQKEALSLIASGYDVTVIAKLDPTVAVTEERLGIKIIRVPIFKVKRAALRPAFSVPGRASKRNVIDEPRTYRFPAWVNDNISLRARQALKGLRFVYKVCLAFVGYSKKYLKYLRPLVLAKKIPCLARPITIISFNLQLLKAARNDNYDVIHAHDLNTLIAGYFIARKNNAKVVYDSHELYLNRNRFEPYTRFGRWVRTKIEGYLARKSDVVITVNDSIADILAESYSIEKPLVIMNIPSGKQQQTGFENVSLRDCLKISRQSKIMLYSGAITFNRGLESLIKSMVFLPDCHLVMMGFGAEDYKARLQEVVLSHGVDKRFSFFGPVPGHLVTSYAKSADLGIAPIENTCLSYYLCSPNKLFEYLLAGLPVITSNFPELKCVVEKFNVGGTFDPTSPQQISDAVNGVFSDKGMSNRLASAQKRILIDYSWENEEKKLLSAYESLN